MPPDEQQEVQDEQAILLNGEEITEDEITEKLKGLIETKNITISIGETRQNRQFESNRYNETSELGISGLAPFLNSLTCDKETRRSLSARAVGLLTARVAQMYTFMKVSIHKQQEADGLKNIDYRAGEKENE